MVTLVGDTGGVVSGGVLHVGSAPGEVVTVGETDEDGSDGYDVGGYGVVLAGGEVVIVDDGDDEVGDGFEVDEVVGAGEPSPEASASAGTAIAAPPSTTAPATNTSRLRTTAPRVRGAL